MSAVVVDGKQFARGGERFLFRGVTYGTFAPRGDGALFPDSDAVKKDFSRMAERGFTVVRTYTAPPEDVLELAEEWRLQILAGVFYPDWRYLVGASASGRREILRGARRVVAETSSRLAGHDAVLGLCLGNEIPADVIRWVGVERIQRAMGDLVSIAREADPGQLVTYAGYPTAEYLQVPDIDFVTFNVFLERELDLRRYLNRLHNLAGDRPLVLGEVGLHAGDGPEGAQQQADVLDWQLGTAIERGVAGTCVFSWTDDWVVGGQRVEDWRFGLTTADREPRPALEVVERWNRRTVADLDQTWPAISVVICAYNAEATLEECLLHTCALDFPNLEIIVVDDGSTDRTAEIARGHPRARLVSIPHGGLSVARNEGWKAATGELIAYLDSDAYPTPEWLHYLSLGLYSSAVAAVGGPNVPPVDDPPGAQVVARSPGGPVHVLIGDDRAEHVPGCNMAFWRYALQEIGGFDPIYTSAGDDVDVCWKVLDQGYEIGFHPAALVWHHRRPGLRTYLRQQRGYGRAEALVESRHPDRFTPLGTARWSGRIYNSLVPGGMRQRVYRGVFGAAPFQSIYGGGGHMIDLAHQAGVPVAAALAATLPLGLLEGALAFPGVLALLFILGLFVLDVVRTRAPRGWAGSHLRFRADVAAHHLLQPLVRLGGRCWRPNVQRGEIPPHEDLPGPARRVARHTWLLPADRPRPELTGSLVGRLRRAGLRLTVTTGWEDYDAKILGSALVHADLVTSGYPEGCMQVRLRWRPRWARVCIGAAAIAWTAVVSPATGVLLALLGLVEIGRGVHRPAAAIRRVLLLHTDRAENGVAA